MKTHSIISVVYLLILTPWFLCVEAASVEFPDTVTANCSSQGESNKCEVVGDKGFEHLEEGKLSSFWGYDFVGVDLMKEALADTELTMTNIATSEHVNLSEISRDKLSSELQAVVDDNYEYTYGSHGTRVNNIILRDGNVGVSVNSKLAATNIFEYGGDGKFRLPKEDFIKKGIKVYAASETVYHDKVDYLSSLVEEGVITIRSAGNRHPEVGIEQGNPGVSIIVGQLSPLGVPASSSSEGKEVTILAPGRNYSFARGSYDVFGGTSGAQPLVAGCVSNVTSVLPDITQDEVETLIIKSAIPTLNSQDKEKKNGAGTINCYKLAKLALKLKRSWPASRKYINAESLFDFSDEANGLIRKAELIPLNESFECVEKKKLNLLRKAFLLDPKNEKTIKEIISIYRSQGFSLNAQLYESLLGYSKEKVIQLNEEYVNSHYFSGDILRYSISKFDAPLKVTEKALKAEDDSTVLVAAANSRGRIANDILEERLTQIVLNEDLDGYNLTYFEQVYFDKNALDASALFEACGKMTPVWEKEEYNSSIISCLYMMKHDAQKAATFYKNQLSRETPEFLSAFKRNFESWRVLNDNEVASLHLLLNDKEVSAENKAMIRSIVESIK